MPISEVIRRKRKELEMTQEQVAQRLGVSAPAVNKWEKGSSYPDITLLPPLARLLETDVNTLLCFREELSEEEIGQICNEMTKLICEEGLKAGFEMAEKKIREYPNCMVLIYSLNTCLDGSVILYSANETEEELKIYQNKIIAYYEFIVSRAEEGRTREGAVYMLAGKYMNMERYDEAEEILKTLPERPADRRVLQAKLLANRGRVSEAAELLEKKVLGDSSELHLTLLKLLELAMDEGREEDARAIAQIGKQTAELYSLWGYNSTLLPMELSVRKKDVRASVGYIRKMLQACRDAEGQEAVDAESPLYRKLHQSLQKRAQENADSETEQRGKAYGENMIPILLRELRTSPAYAFLQEDEEFQNLLQEYTSL